MNVETILMIAATILSNLIMFVVDFIKYLDELIKVIAFGCGSTTSTTAVQLTNSANKIRC